MPRLDAPAGALPAFFSCLLAACSATDPMISARAAYSAGDYAQANQLVEELVAEDDSNVHLWQLEHGVTELAVGDPDTAIQSWRAARDRLDELGGQGILETMGAWLSDDTALDYEGAMFERVLVRGMLAVAELVAPDRMFGDDAVAYANQVSAEQRRLIDELQAQRDDLKGDREEAPDVRLVKVDAPFQLVAFGSYLVAIVREADPLTADEARIQLLRAVEMEPEREWLKEELQRVEQGRFAAPGKGVVHVLGLVGRGPYRVEEFVEGSQEAFLIFGLLIGAIQDSIPQISLKGVPIDRLAFHSDNPDALRVVVDGVERGSTREVTDVEAVAQTEYQATYDYRVARGLVRRAIKIALVEGVRGVVLHNNKDNNNNNQQKPDAAELAIGLGFALLGSLWQATEVADLRCWSLIPASCQAMRLELDPGVHEIVVQPERDGVPSGNPQTLRVEVTAGRATYVAAVCPTMGGAAPLLSRDAERPPETAPEGQ